MLLLMPINYYISSQFSSIQKKIMTRTDKRIHTTNEVLQNIRIIKYFAWEERFGHVVNDSRTAELKQLWNRYVLWAIAATSWYGSPMLITFLSFLCYTVIEKKDLNAPIAFTALSLFNVLRVPLDQLADMITNVLQTKVSVDRVEEFLREEETEKYLQLKHVDPIPDAPLIGFKDATLSWGSRKDALAGGTNAGFQLQNINITFAPGKLNVIAGATGSGKTSLLMGLLGEMTHLEGSVHLPGVHSREDLRPDPATGLTQSVAYCAQQPWLVNDTIKQNILFASPYDEERYKAVLVACSLERDLTILDHGDETEVGEKGISLSGGQKQRISLARALYSNAAHLLLDDCLSAVDSHTAKWIHEFCITGPLMEGRTCILVTHNVALCVPSAEKVIVLDNGRVLTQGDPETVVKSGALGGDELLKTGMSSRQNSRMPSRVPSFVGEECVQLNGEASFGHQNGKSVEKKTKASKDETKTEGGVSWKVYKLYLSAMGPWWYWLIVIVIFLAQQIGSVATSVWIREWAAMYGTPNEEMASVVKVHSYSAYNVGCHATGNCMWALPMSSPSDNGTFKVTEGQSDVNVWYYLGIYALLGAAYTILSFFREMVVFYGSLKASRNIHQVLMENIMRAKLKFFDSTPLGRIMNRFSKDMEAIDQEVAPVALACTFLIAWAYFNSDCV
jgi:ABC-type multidrug transport system fused ATPase/permease subunit